METGGASGRERTVYNCSSAGCVAAGTETLTTRYEYDNQNRLRR